MRTLGRNRHEARHNMAGCNEFRKCLFSGSEGAADGGGEPDHFRDLNLDQIVASMVSKREPYDLLAFFHSPLHDVDAVRYRQAACRDLEDERVRKAVDGFADGMVVVQRRRNHALQLRHRNHRFRWFREAVRVYCDTVVALRDELAGADLSSDAFVAFRDFLVDYTARRLCGDDQRGF